jgi:hypothetical protein
MTAAIVIPIVILISVLYRARGLFARQRLVAGSLRRRMLISLAIGGGVVVLGASSAGVLPWDIAGMAAGAAFGWLAARWTTIEESPGGRTYQPNRWAAGAVLVLFIGRVVYRLVELIPLLSQTVTPAALSSVSLFADPLTSALFVLTFAYYASYCAALLPLARRSPV